MWNPFNSNNGAYITVDEAKKKYGNDPYFLDALKFDTKTKWFPKFDVPSNLPGMSTFNKTNRVALTSNGKFNTAAFDEYVKERNFLSAIDDRVKAASDERGSVFDREGAPPGAGADARDYSSYNAVIFDDLNKDDRRDFSRKSSQQMIDAFGSDPYFADFIAEGNRVSRTGWAGKSLR
jgi:hypothetical protein